MDQPLLALPVFVPILIVLMAFGRRLLAFLNVSTGSALESSIFGLGMGFGTLAYLVLLIGLVGALYPAVLIGILAVMTAVSLRQIREIITEVFRALKSNAKAKLKAGDSFITLAVVALAATGLVCALAPPVGLDWDGLSYHLAIPKLYLTHHSIYYVFFTSHSNFPFLTEMLYTVGLALGSPGVAKLFHFTMYLGTAAALYSMCVRNLDSLTGKLAALLFMSVPIALHESGMAYADLGTAFYVTLAVYAVMNWERTSEQRWLVLAGLMGGFALSTKVLAGVPIFALCVWVLLSARGERRLSVGFRSALTLGVISLLVGSPWYIKSYIYTGNPFYPFLYNLFPHTRNWSQSAADAYRGSQLAFGMGRGLAQGLMSPWNLTMSGYRFYDHRSLLGLIGPAFLALTPACLLAKNLDKTILKVGAIGLVCMAAWFVLMQESRYLLGVLPLFSVVAGAGAAGAIQQWRVGRYAAIGVVVVSAGSTLVIGGMLAMACSRAAMGLESRDDYLTSPMMFESYPAISFINDTLPASAKVVLFDETRGFYLDREYMWGNPGHHEMIPWARLKTGGDMVRYFIGIGYTHALVNGNSGNSNDLLHTRLIPEAIGRGLMSEVYSSNGVTVYEFVK